MVSIKSIPFVCKKNQVEGNFKQFSVDKCIQMVYDIAMLKEGGKQNRELPEVEGKDRGEEY